MRVILLAPLFALSLAGCSSSSGGGAGAGPGGPYGGVYGASYWWYDDYYGYWNDYYPWCCDNQGEFDELIKKWWNGLDPARQQEIKEKYQDWQEDHGQPDLVTLRGDLATRWHAMTPEQRQALRDNRQNRPSISNPDKSPRSPLDDRGGTLPRAENGLLAPSTLPKADNGLLTPSAQPRGDARPHLPRTLATPVRPTVRPAIRPGFTPMRSVGGGRRR
ncbi:MULTISPECIES: hypothetical protein [Aeromonas]|uniref:hypothetical protein n=1 Tax=Aeromonas sp. XH TaxID=3081770 RepID=UPI0029671815|nr:hypothetical protein [Aeromonas sp. XH]WOX50171.1 hypothetical protein R2B70_09405 [Aeromonas sp. XH]